MEELIRKALLLGVGAVALTKEKMETIFDDLIKTAEKIEEKDLLSRIIEKGQETREELEERIAKKLGRVINKTELATKEDILKLEKKIEMLENTIEGQKG